MPCGDWQANCITLKLFKLIYNLLCILNSSIFYDFNKFNGVKY
jgi:hypothetical protein